jgi:hypothetical protein
MLSPGLFIKFFEKRKALKRNKMIKFLMAKYLRKIILLTGLRNFILVIKKTPVFFVEFLTFLYQPIIHKFLNPFTQKITTEFDIKSDFFIKILYFIFLKNNSFTKNKTKAKGRIKRKIYRKLVLTNGIID